MNREELIAEFEKNVAYLHRNIPPDDIYFFAEETLMASFFFLKKWSECVDLEKICKDDPVARKWVVNILSLMRCRNDGIEVNIKLNLESLYEDDN